MITKKELLAGRDILYPFEYTPEISKNLDFLLEKLNVVRQHFGRPMRISSGWRPPSLNKKIAGAATKSAHTIGLAADVYDGGELRGWVLGNLQLIKALNLYIEDFRWTPTWVHFQAIAPKSKKRIFIPYADIKKFPMTAPNSWSGLYDPIFD